jgi:hypothetical protein
MRSHYQDSSSGRLPGIIVYDLSSFTIRYVYGVLSCDICALHCRGQHTARSDESRVALVVMSFIGPQLNQILKPWLKGPGKTWLLCTIATV